MLAPPCFNGTGPCRRESDADENVGIIFPYRGNSYILRARMFMLFVNRAAWWIRAMFALSRVDPPTTPEISS